MQVQEDAYLVLGLEKGATQEEVDARYNELMAKYREDRFLEGEAGADAARKISRLERAYKDCLEDIRMEEEKKNSGSVYTSIEDEIRAGHYDNAQRMLDDVDMRDAEWHYYQSMIYFKKGWHAESKTQLELCIALEPHNEKYNKALDKMNNFMSSKSSAKANSANNAESAQQQQSQYEQRAGYSDRQTNADANANACCDTCCTMMCCDSCCECMGGDLIPCC